MRWDWLSRRREDLVNAFEKEIKKQKLQGKVDVRVTGCHGFVLKDQTSLSILMKSAM